MAPKAAFSRRVLEISGLGIAALMAELQGGLDALRGSVAVARRCRSGEMILTRPLGREPPAQQRRRRGPDRLPRSPVSVRPHQAEV